MSDVNGNLVVTSFILGLWSEVGVTSQGVGRDCIPTASEPECQVWKFDLLIENFRSCFFRQRREAGRLSDSIAFT